jgi:hypothetical protein
MTRIEPLDSILEDVIARRHEPQRLPDVSTLTPYHMDALRMIADRVDRRVTIELRGWEVTSLHWGLEVGLRDGWQISLSCTMLDWQCGVTHDAANCWLWTHGDASHKTALAAVTTWIAMYRPDATEQE